MKPLRKLTPKKKLKKRFFAEPKIRLLIDVAKMRSSKGVSLRQCAEACGLSHPTLYRIERGASPSLEAALTYAKFMEISVENIWEVK